MRAEIYLRQCASLRGDFEFYERADIYGHCASLYDSEFYGRVKVYLGQCTNFKVTLDSTGVHRYI